MIKLKTNLISFILNKPQIISVLTMVAISFLVSFSTPGIAFADFDPNTAVKSVLSFFQLLIILAAAKIVAESIGKGHVVPAAITILAAAFFYVILDPELMKEIGSGFKALLKMKGSGSEPSQ